MGMPLRIGRSVAWPTQNSSGTIKPGLGLGGYDEYDVPVGMHYAIRARGGAGEADKLSSANCVR